MEGEAKRSGVREYGPQGSFPQKRVTQDFSINVVCVAVPYRELITHKDTSREFALTKVFFSFPF